MANTVNRDDLPYPENIGKRFAMPEARTFGDMFSESAPWVFDDPEEKRRRKADPYFRSDCNPGVPFNPSAPVIRDHGWRGRDTSVIGSFCSMTGGDVYRSLRVTPTAATIEAIRGNTIDCGAADTFSFKIYDHGDGKALVVATHSLILGDVWLGYVEASSIPSLS